MDSSSEEFTLFLNKWLDTGTIVAFSLILLESGFIASTAVRVRGTVVAKSSDTCFMLKTSDGGIVILDISEWQIGFMTGENGRIPVIPGEEGEVDTAFLLSRPGVAITAYTLK